MATESIRVSAFLPADPDRVFDAFLNAREHRDFTGHAATIVPNVGTAFQLWDGAISGRVGTLEPARRILLSWRLSTFPPKTLESRVEIVLEPAGLGTRVVVLHSSIPEGFGRALERGWMRNYLEPLYHYLKEGRRAAIGQGGWDVPDPELTRQYPVLRPDTPPPPPPPPVAETPAPAAPTPKKEAAKKAPAKKKPAKKAAKKAPAKKKPVKKAAKKAPAKKKPVKKAAKKAPAKKKPAKKAAKKAPAKKKPVKKAAKKVAKKVAKKKAAKKVAKKRPRKK
ncbi:MAG: SRPBCC domain-containing protein [Deltaproteobacteria bacterium]|nr:SRPBCC domain-containing protein [Deltaproteobacteria bacterium]